MFQRLLDAWYKLLHEDATPNKIAMGFAVGLFTSFFPAPVLDTVAALALAYLIRGNRASCLIGNNLGLMMFPIIPFVLGIEYFIGRLVLDLPPSVSMPQNWTFWMFLKSQGGTYYALVIGALVLAIPSAIIGFVVVRSATAYWQDTKRNRESL